MQGYFLSIRTFFVLVAALSALLLVGGCGDSDDSATGSSDGEVTVETGSLSKAAFVKQANKICLETQKKFQIEAVRFIERAGKNPPKPTEASPEEELTETIVVKNFQDQVDELASLGAPSGDEEEISAILNALQQEVDNASEDPATFIKSEGSFGKAPKLASAYGLTECATVG